MLEVKHLDKKYSKVHANKDISLTIPDENVTLLVGPNGAGKSTLIKCIMGLLSYDGEITINGVSNKSAEGRGLIGYVPEIPYLYDLLTVGEHLEFVARVYKLENWEAEAEKLLSRFKILDKKDTMASELSKGMKQKVSICCALLPHPKFILFDEPMIGLDPRAIMELKKIMLELKEAKSSLLISTHILDTVDELWDKVCIMTEGSLVAVADKEQLADNNESLEQLFFRVTEGQDQAIKMSSDFSEDMESEETEHSEQEIESEKDSEA